MQFTDSHCHLDFSPLGDNTAHLSQTIEACVNARIHQIVLPSVAPNNWQQVLKLASDYSDNPQINIMPCLGIHPWYLSKLTNADLATLEQVVIENKTHIVAIGETGLDGKIAERDNNLNKQIEFFNAHIELAKAHHLPLIVHHYKAHQEITKRLNQAKPARAGIIHAFSGSYQQAKNYLDLGFKLGIGGTITYERAQKTIKTIAKLPLESLVLETDAPSMPLFGLQGEPNHPKYLINVFDTLCHIRSETPEVIAEQLELNIKNLFSLATPIG